MSFIRLSTLSCARLLADSTFFRRSHPAARRKTALGLEKTSILYLPLNSSAKCSTSARSKLRPPKLGSADAPSTVSWPLLNATTETW